LIMILGLAALFLGSPPTLVLAAGAGAGSAVAAVAVNTASSLVPTSWRRAGDDERASTFRWALYLLAGIAGAVTLGPWLVLVLLSCGVVEIGLRSSRFHSGPLSVAPIPLLATGAAGLGTLASLSWVAFKVGALSYGGGFVIIPLMQNDAVNIYGWMTGAQFLNAVALGQITPGPVVQTVAVVGYAAAGLSGGVLAAAIAFSPSFVVILIGARHFDLLRSSPTVRGFLDGAGPAAIGAIVGSAVTLAQTLSQPWQFVVLAAAAGLLLILRRGTVLTLLAAAAAGIALVSAGVPLPG